ncbi:MAG: sulfotransferase domain-containing protein, partial [Planctomycetia bacterium]|nr:sulfotransferase domain-containing protein [Planctomycetia bacterium]
MERGFIAIDGEAWMESQDQPTLRLAVISTQRSGNTWLRGLLAEVYGLEEIPVHFPDQVDWENLPGRFVIQIHWHPEPAFVENLDRHEVRVVVLARHPLDVLMSWLNYAYYDHMEGNCRGKEVCDKCDAIGLLPRSDAFRDYVEGKIGRWLLSHSPAWWDRPGVLQVRYEDLVRDPEATLGRLADEIGRPPLGSIAGAIESSAIGRKKPDQGVWHYHYWQGQPGLWRAMLPAAEARAIVRVAPTAFEVLGYACDPDESLGPDQADRNWLRLQLDSTREHLSLERSKHRRKSEDLKAVRVHLD